ncbi:hypothetical protein [Pseudomonas sp. PLB05]|jgi:hypothetical protein|nr:hypothetical protein [Pseudomonas sp. PLB05]MCD4863245.1 hypothetical protein [Pseudomonas sp. PLB05]
MKRPLLLSSALLVTLALGGCFDRDQSDQQNRSSGEKASVQMQKSDSDK